MLDAYLSFPDEDILINCFKSLCALTASSHEGLDDTIWGLHIAINKLDEANRALVAKVALRIEAWCEFRWKDASNKQRLQLAQIIKILPITTGSIFLEQVLRDTPESVFKTALERLIRSYR